MARNAVTQLVHPMTAGDLVKSACVIAWSDEFNVLRARRVIDVKSKGKDGKRVTIKFEQDENFKDDILDTRRNAPILVTDITL